MSDTNVPELQAAECAAHAEQLFHSTTHPSTSRPTTFGKLASWKEIVLTCIQLGLALHHDLRRLADTLEDTADAISNIEHGS